MLNVLQKPSPFAPMLPPNQLVTRPVYDGRVTSVGTNANVPVTVPVTWVPPVASADVWKTPLYVTVTSPGSPVQGLTVGNVAVTPWTVSVVALAAALAGAMVSSRSLVVAISGISLRSRSLVGMARVLPGIRGRVRQWLDRLRAARAEESVSASPRVHVRVRGGAPRRNDSGRSHTLPEGELVEPARVMASKSAPTVHSPFLRTMEIPLASKKRDFGDAGQSCALGTAVAALDHAR